MVSIEKSDTQIHFRLAIKPAIKAIIGTSKMFKGPAQYAVGFRNIPIVPPIKPAASPPHGPKISPTAGANAIDSGAVSPPMNITTGIIVDAPRIAPKIVTHETGAPKIVTAPVTTLLGASSVSEISIRLLRFSSVNEH